ncbi:hypothetical protein ACFSCX_05935 [Bacillus salitolerans]|uniref:Uncharacterized protein n=1 Tax=Bacillus salitolerans TaxID=1437434 RepID=A0ABW4LMH1_9BACI
MKKNKKIFSSFILLLGLILLACRFTNIETANAIGAPIGTPIASLQQLDYIKIKNNTNEWITARFYQGTEVFTDIVGEGSRNTAISVGTNFKNNFSNSGAVINSFIPDANYTSWLPTELKKINSSQYPYYWWTSYRDHNPYYYVVANSSGDSIPVDSGDVSQGIRVIMQLHSGLKVESGSGTISDPYVLTFNTSPSINLLTPNNTILSEVSGKNGLYLNVVF